MEINQNYGGTKKISLVKSFVDQSYTGAYKELKLPKGLYWAMDTAQVPVDKPLEYNKIRVSEAPVFILQAASQSPVIMSVMVDGPPLEPFASDGDLWLSTWADDNNIYSGWGDGRGPLNWQGSAIYHPGIKRYLFMTDFDVFDAPHPWGPWTYAGSWTTWKTRPGVKEWQGGYQPGIISKETGPYSYWFTISGQNKKPNITYTYNLGKMILKMKDKGIR